MMRAGAPMTPGAARSWESPLMKQLARLRENQHSGNTTSATASTAPDRARKPSVADNLVARKAEGANNVNSCDSRGFVSCNLERDSLCKDNNAERNPLQRNMIPSIRCRLRTAGASAAVSCPLPFRGSMGNRLSLHTAPPRHPASWRNAQVMNYSLLSDCRSAVLACLFVCPQPSALPTDSAGCVKNFHDLPTFFQRLVFSSTQQCRTTRQKPDPPPRVAALRGTCTPAGEIAAAESQRGNGQEPGSGVRCVATGGRGIASTQCCLRTFQRNVRRFVSTEQTLTPTTTTGATAPTPSSKKEKGSPPPTREKDDEITSAESLPTIAMKADDDAAAEESVGSAEGATAGCGGGGETPG